MLNFTTVFLLSLSTFLFFSCKNSLINTHAEITTPNSTAEKKPDKPNQEKLTTDKVNTERDTLPKPIIEVATVELAKDEEVKEEIKNKILKKHKNIYFEGEYVIGKKGKPSTCYKDGKIISKRTQQVNLLWQIEFETEGNTLPVILLKRYITKGKNKVPYMDKVINSYMKEGKICFKDKHFGDTLRANEISKIEYALMVEKDTSIYSEINKNYAFPVK